MPANKNIPPTRNNALSTLWSKFGVKKRNLPAFPVFKKKSTPDTTSDASLQPNANPHLSSQSKSNSKSQPKQAENQLFSFISSLEDTSISPTTIRNYRSDIKQFLTFTNENEISKAITNDNIAKFTDFQRNKGLMASSIKRKLASLNQFSSWLNHKSGNAHTIKTSNPKQNKTERKTHSEASPVTHQTNQYLSDYLLALKASDCSLSTLRNYRSDINQFIEFTGENRIVSLITKPQLDQFALNQSKKGLKRASVMRKLSSITQFGLWAEGLGLVDKIDPEWPSKITDENFEKPVKLSPKPQYYRNITQDKAYNTPKTSTPLIPLSRLDRLKTRIKQSKKIITNPIKPVNTTRQSKPSNLLPYLNLAAIMLFISGLGYFAYQQFAGAAPSLAFPNSPTRPDRVLSFQGRLTDTAQNPLTTATNMEYRLYDSLDSGGTNTLLWDSNTCSVTPDQDGIFAANLGAGAGAGSDDDNCGAEIADSVFTENSNVWLEVQIVSETLTPRQPIRTVAFALNSETVQGFPVNSNEIATANTLITMNDDGEIVLGETSPVIRSTTGDFTLEGQALLLQTTTGSDGDIVLDADGIGGVISRDYLYAPGATLSATWAGGTALVTRSGPSGTGNIQEWQDESGTALAHIKSGGTLEIDVPTAISEALILKSTDNNTTKNIFETQNSTGAKRFYIRGDNTLVHGIFINSTNTVAASFSPTSVLTSGGNQLGLNLTMNYAATSNTGVVTVGGGQFSVTNSGTADITQESSFFKGGQFSANHKGLNGSTLSNMYAGSFNLGVGSSGGTGTLTNGRVISINSSDNGTGAITNLYGLYIEDQNVGTNNYAIYTNAGLNRFGDQLKVVGSQDIIQNIIQGHSTQTANLTEWQNSAGTPLTVIDTSGNLGIGINNPLQKLHVEGQCVTGDTRLRRKKKKKRNKDKLSKDDPPCKKCGHSATCEECEYYEDVRIDEINEGDVIQTLDETTGLFVDQEVEKLMDMGVKQTLMMVTDTGKRIRTTGNHPYLVRKTNNLSNNRNTLIGGIFQIDQSPKIETLTKDSYIAIANEGLKSVVKISKKQKREIYAQYIDTNRQKFFGAETFAWTIAYLLKYNKMQPGTLIIDLEYPGHQNRIQQIIAGTSPNTNIIFKSEGHSRDSHAHHAAYDAYKGKIKEDLEIKIDRSALKRVGQGPVTLIPLNQTGRTYGHLKTVYKETLDLSSSHWTKAQYVKKGMQIATVDGWETIVTIFSFDREQVWDIQVANTHNFVGNGIVAHNTYISGNTGIGDDTPDYALDVVSGDAIAASFDGRVIGVDAVNDDEFVTLLQLTSGTGQYWSRTGSNISPTTAGDDLYLNTGEILGVGYDPTTISGGVAAFNGNVGIGTSSPDTKLSLSLGDSNSPHGLNLDSDSATGNSARLFFNTTTDTGNAFAVTKLGVGTASYLSFNYNATPGTSSGTNALSILDGGNVGIGTTTPENLLDINTTSITSGIAFDSREALTSYDGDTWLRLNQNNQWTSGVYTPGNMQVNGELRSGAGDYGAYSLQSSDDLYINDFSALIGGVNIGGSSDPGTGNLVMSGIIDANGTGTHDIAGTLNLSGNNLTSTGALTINSNGSTESYVNFSDDSITNAWIGTDYNTNSHNNIANISNTLIRADEKYTVTMNNGCDSGSIANIFDGDTNTTCVINDASPNEIITIIFNNAEHYWNGLEFHWNWGRGTDTLLVERLRDTDTTANGTCDGGVDEVWETVAHTSITNNVDRTIGIGNYICGIRTTISGTSDITGDTRLAEIKGYQFYQGEHEDLYFDVTGGTIYGETTIGTTSTNRNLIVQGNIGIGDTTPDYKLDVNGTGRFTGTVDLDADLELNSTLTDINNQVGTPGQVLSTTGLGVDWIDASGVGTDNQTLTEVLAEGNSAGTYDIDLNNNALLNIDWSTSDDGDGSGLDADLLDGLNNTSFLRTEALSTRSIADADSADNYGLTAHYLPGSASNRPAGTDHALFTQSYSSSWSTQIASDWRTNEWYVRTQNNTAWGSWEKLWHSGNDGSGSTLDADTLDTLDSLSFLRSDTSDNYTSGTLTFDSGTVLGVSSGSTLDINGDLSIADTDIALDGASTNLNATGNFSINTDDLFVQKSDGNVGIGTSSPSYTLDVNGTSRFTDNVRIDSGKNISFYDHNGTFPTADGGFVWDLNDDQAKIYAQQPSTDRIDLVFKIADNVGSTDRFLYWIDSYTGETDDAYPLLMDGSKTVFNYPTAFGTGTSKDIDFYIMGNGESSLNTAYFFGDAANKRIGIGTTSPSYKLDVVSGDAIAASFNGRVIGVDAVQDDEFVTLAQLSGGVGSYWTKTGTNLLPTTSGDDLYLPSSSILGVGYDPSSITGGVAAFNGNVGIGTTAPSQKLDINGRMSFGTNLGDAISLYEDRIGATNMYGLGVESGHMYFKTADGYRWYSATNADTGTSDIMELQNDGDLILSTGNIGIGIQPSNLLDINTVSTISGIAFDSREALTGYDGDTWLRLNQSNQWTSGVYTPGNMQVNGELRSGAGDYGPYSLQSSDDLYINDFSALMGGVHIGGTSDPGTDNLIVDGTSTFTGSTYQNNSFNRDSHTGTKYLDIAFTNAVANQKVDIYFDLPPATTVFWGNLEVEVTSYYANQNSVGSLKKIFSIGLNAQGGSGPYTPSMYDNTSYYDEATGVVADNWAIDGVHHDTTNGRYYITLIHRTSTGNTPRVKITGFGNTSAQADNISTLTAGTVYTTDTTTFYKPVVENRSMRIGYNNAQNIDQQDYSLVVNGNVGIGSISPAYKLDVVSGDDIAASFDGRVIGADAVQNDEFVTLAQLSGGVGSYWTRTGTNLSPTTGGDDLYLPSSSILGVGYDPTTITGGVAAFDGNVGIGTTNPGQKLEVNGNIVSGIYNSTRVQINGNGGTNSIGEYYSVDANPRWALGRDLYVSGGAGLALGTSGGIYSGVGTNTSGNELYLYTNESGLGSAGSSVRLTINAAGNVGIGTTSPSEKLHVEGNIRIGADAYIDDDDTAGGNADDWIKLSDFIEMKSGSVNYGIVLRDRDTTNYFGFTQVGGTSYLADSNTASNYFIKGDGADATVGGTMYLGGASTYYLNNATSNLNSLDLAGLIDANGTGTHDIAGTLNLSGNILTSSGTLAINASNNNDVNIGTNDLYVDNSASMVGLGTATPDNKLTVLGTTSTKGLLWVGGESQNYGNVLLSQNVLALADKNPSWTVTTTNFGNTVNAFDGKMGTFTSADASAGDAVVEIDWSGNKPNSYSNGNHQLMIMPRFANTTLYGWYTHIKVEEYTGATWSTMIDEDMIFDETNQVYTTATLSGLYQSDKFRVTFSGGSAGTNGAAYYLAQMVLVHRGEEAFPYYMRKDNPEIWGQLQLEDGTAGAPSLSFIQDINTGIYRPGTDNIALTTGGTSRLSIDNNSVIVETGNLAVSGAIRAGSITPTNYNHFGAGGTVDFADNASDLYIEDELEVDGSICLNGVCESDWGDIGYWTLSGTDLYPDSTSYDVGIGTSSPEEKLHVVGNAIFKAGASGRIQLVDNDTAGDVNQSSPKLSFWGHASPTGITGPSIQKVQKASYGRGDLVFWQHGGADYTSEIEAMVIAYDGNIGINDTTPDHKLDLDGDFMMNSDTNDAENPSGINNKFYISKMGSTTQALSIYVDDANVVFASEQDETAGAAGGFEFIMDNDDSLNPLFTISKKNGALNDGVLTDVLTVDKFGEVRGKRFEAITSSNYFIEPAEGGISLMLAGSAGIGKNLSATMTTGATLDTVGAIFSTGANNSLRSFYDPTSYPNDYINISQAVNNSYIDFYGGDLDIRDEGSSSRLFIQDTDGNVGIGTDTPTRKLEVHAGHSDTQLQLSSIGDGGTNDAFLNLWASEPGKTYTGAGIGNNIINSSSAPNFNRINTGRGGSFMRLLDDKINFNVVDDTGAITTSTTINGDGNVGIGTTSPDFKLQVNGTIAPETTNQDLGSSALRWDLFANTINADSTVTLTGLGTGTDNTVLILDGSSNVTTDEIDSRVWGTSLLDGSGTANYVARFSDTNTLTTGVIYDNGTNVGIGTADPKAKLHIDRGGIVMSQDVASDANMSYRSVHQWHSDVSSITGNMAISVPDQSAIMLKIVIDGYDYTNAPAGAWQVIIGGYWSGTEWYSTSAEIQGEAPFSKVRLMKDGVAPVIVLGDNNTIWNHPQINIDLPIAGFSHQDSMATGWSTSILSSIAYTADEEPALNYFWNSAGNLGIGTTNPASQLDIDTGSNTLGLRLRGIAETAEIADMYVGSYGQLVISTVAGTDGSAFIDLRPEDNHYGLILRESDGTGDTVFANFYVKDATNDYLSINVSSITDTDALVITANNRVGLGITNPGAKLQNYVKSTETLTNITLNRNRAADTNWYMIMNRDSYNDNEFLLRADGNAYADGSWNGGGADVAELYLFEESVQPGDLVSIPVFSNNPGKTMKKSAGKPYDTMVVGVVSTDPGLVAGFGDAELDTADGSDMRKPVALVGRVPVKVNLENGPIYPGDYLTSSSTPGIAMKSTHPGKIIGQAMEEYTGAIQKSIGVINVEQDYENKKAVDLPSIPPLNIDEAKIMVYVFTGYHDPSISLNDSGEIVIDGDSTNGYTVTNSGNDITSVSTTYKAFIANITAGLTKTQDLIVENTASITNLTASNLLTNNLSVNNLVISGQSLTTYITNVVNNMDIINNSATVTQLQIDTTTNTNQITTNTTNTATLAAQLETQEASISSALAELTAQKDSITTDHLGIGTTAPATGSGKVIDTATGAYLSEGGVWTNVSDVNKKENFQEVDSQSILDKIANLDITRWNYKVQDSSITHIGPMAQDFYAAFGLGEFATNISSLDPASIALSGVQALNDNLNSLAADLQTFKDNISNINEQINNLQKTDTEIQLQLDSQTELSNISDQDSTISVQSDESTRLQQLIAEEASISGKTTLGDLIVTNDATISGTTRLGLLVADTGEINQLNTTTITAQDSRLKYLESKVAILEQVDIQTANIVNATISGTLYANNIDGFDERVAEAFNQTSLLGSLLGQDEDYDPFTDLDLSASLGDNNDLGSSTNFGLGLGSTATTSAQLNMTLADLGLSENEIVITPSAAFINKYLEVNGSGYIGGSLGVQQDLIVDNSLTVGNSIAVGGSMAVGDSLTVAHSINVGESLMVGNTYFTNNQISLMSGLMTLTDDGRVTIDGNLRVAGALDVQGDLRVKNTLLANLIKPEDIEKAVQLQLSEKDPITGEINESRFEIVDEMGTPVATISADGMAEFTKLRANGDIDLAGDLKVSRGISIDSETIPEATESGDLTTTKTAGKAKLPAGTMQVVIKSLDISDETLIYITPIGSTRNQVIYIKEQIAEDPDTIAKEGHFTVAIDAPLAQDIEFNWWMVN